ncbi:hypothetical protein BPOR_0059g00080 [Botrytis porri]|uniref:Uncharacterized protein n=1 Tax=Botrytis porri TaxID=87229 RepID=A0A4Z1L184_9HELO|nr:hypothetical protein BPOR_0059g00080 [Botrytis porri]
MQRKLPRLYGGRPIDVSSQGLWIPSITSQNLVMNSNEVKAAICEPLLLLIPRYGPQLGSVSAPIVSRASLHAKSKCIRASFIDDHFPTMKKRTAASYMKIIQQHPKYLIERLAKHGDIVINRWKKKSQVRRQALLLEAIPNICQERWVILRHRFTPEGKEIPPINSDGQMEPRSLETQDHLLLNWLSLEVLKTNPAVLFALLYNRTVYSPQDWASFDSRQLDSPFFCRHFDVEFSAKCDVMYGLEYGEVVDWKAGPAHRADILGFPKASCSRVSSLFDGFTSQSC